MVRIYTQAVSGSYTKVMDLSSQNDTRIYVQMAPDVAAVRSLVAIGDTLPPQPSGRLLPARELHVTLIHFGKTRDVLRSIQRAVPLNDQTYDDGLGRYVAATRSILNDEEYHLTPLGYDRYGTHKTTLVGRYEAPAQLHEIRDQAYAELLRFIGACGITNAQQFADDDPNFVFARTFNPHITIYKGYDGSDPATPLPPVTVRFMPLVVSGRGV